ncbi:class I adenylate-forming enzyme family protein [Solwaraspora sp. WMMB335]|uniref:class I adenylate-forming enzyme family protein n=1 Tax=Solwaraspora sp. WMMB335 TaxID=3404118 RepID=UPI003B941A18
MTSSRLPASALLDRFTELAGEHPERPAFVVADPDGDEIVFTFADLVASAHRLADALKDAGVGPGDVVVLAPQNHPGYLGLVLGTWWAGAAVLPISPSFTGEDSGLLLDVVAARLGRPVLVDVRAHARYGTLVLDAGPAATFTLHGDLPPRRPPTTAEQPYLFMTSGGTTGLPKIMPYPLRWVGNARTPYANAGLGNQSGEAVGGRTRLICGSLHHTGNFTVAVHVLLTGSSVIVMTRFDAALACDLLRRHDVYSLGLTPYYMMLILGLPDLDRRVFDGVVRITHGAAPCPHWVKQAWIDLVGPDRIFEVYYSAELGGAGRPTIASGTEWCKKPGTVGRVENVRILDERGQDVPPGVVGEIYTAQTYGQAHGYVGERELRHAPDDASYVSVADLGWLDDDGYLFLADRMSEVLEIDGARIYPSRIEETIGAHPLVADVAVVGLTGEDGQPYVHALIERVLRRPAGGPDDGPPAADVVELTADAVRQWCADRLAAVEIPTVVQFTSHLPRTAEGKMRRSVVRQMSQAATTDPATTDR